MAREDFAKRECVKYGHTYGIDEYGRCTKDGVVTKGVEVHADTNNRLIVRDYSAVIGHLYGDFGWYSEPLRVQEEVIGHSKRDLPDGTIEKVTRVVYRTAEKGMYCEDAVMIFKKDGVTLVKDGGRRPAPFEVLK